jgi:uncharacterized protein YeaO (DUF488 family)
MSKRIAAANVKLKRAYEPPAASDGTRILIDRVWPRGVNKANAAIDQWDKSIAPSTMLRNWFGKSFDDDMRMRFADIGNSSTNSARALNQAGLHSSLRLMTRFITMPSS